MTFRSGVMDPNSAPSRLLERIQRQPVTFSELVEHFGITDGKERKLLFDALLSLLNRGLVLRTGDRGHYLYATERPALPAIDLQPVPVLAVSLGVICEPLAA